MPACQAQIARRAAKGKRMGWRLVTHHPSPRDPPHPLPTPNRFPPKAPRRRVRPAAHSDDAVLWKRRTPTMPHGAPLGPGQRPRHVAGWEHWRTAVSGRTVRTHSRTSRHTSRCTLKNEKTRVVGRQRKGRVRGFDHGQIDPRTYVIRFSKTKQIKQLKKKTILKKT